MAIDQLDIIDFTVVPKERGEIWLAISDHLPWDENEDEHFLLLQEKLNKYMAFIESGEIANKVPESAGRPIVIKIFGKFSPSRVAEEFIERARGAVEEAGFRLEFELHRPQ